MFTIVNSMMCKSTWHVSAHRLSDFCLKSPLTASQFHGSSHIMCVQVIKDTIFNSSLMSGQQSGLPDANMLVQQAIQASPDATLVEPMQE